jgi:leader peptidase (prepilin peptidase) / N-methyltransferase
VADRPTAYRPGYWTLRQLHWPGAAQFAVALFVASAAAFYALALSDAVFATAFAALVLLLAKFDLETFQLPDLGNLALAVLGSAWVAMLGDPAAGLLHAAARAITAAACLSALMWSYTRLRGLEGLGWGDVKLAAAGAIWLDWPYLPLALLIAAAAGILVVAGRAMLSGTRIAPSDAIPFGAFLAPSIWLVWFAGLANLF